MENLFKNISRETLNKITIVFCILGDVLIFYYIWIDAFPRIFKQVFVEVMKSPGLDKSMIPVNFYNELFQLSKQALIIMFVGVLIVHGVNYIFFLKKKEFARKYIKIQTCLGGLLLFLFGFSSLLKGWLYPLCALIGAIMFLAFIGLNQYNTKTLAPKA